QEVNSETSQLEPGLLAPEQLLIVPLSEIELVELTEKHIEYFDAAGRPVHLHSSFVRHYMQRDDGALPIITSIAQLPIPSRRDDAHSLWSQSPLRHHFPRPRRAGSIITKPR